MITLAIVFIIFGLMAFIVDIYEKHNLSDYERFADDIYLEDLEEDE